MARTPLESEMLAHLKMCVAMMEDAMSSSFNTGDAWVPGESDLEIVPDGTVRLSDLRAVIAKAEAA